MEVKINFSLGGLLMALLTVAFVVLRLCGIIAWSWWWIFAPLWIPTALILLTIGVIFLIAFIAAAKEN